MKLKTAILTCSSLLAFLILVNYLAAQAPMNNANTVILNIGQKAATDTITTISETVNSVNSVDVLTAKVQMMQDLAGIATGRMVIVGSSGNTPILAAASGTPVPDQALTAILTKWVIKITDATGNQIFP